MRHVIIGVQPQRLAVLRDRAVQVALPLKCKAEIVVHQDKLIAHQFILRVQAQGLTCCGRGIVLFLLSDKDNSKAVIKVRILWVE